MRRIVHLATWLLLAYAGGVQGAWAATCTKDDFAKAVDQVGAALRKVNTENMPRIQAKMRQLKEKRGWPEDGFEERAYNALQDERIAQFDAQANELLARLDALGSFSPASEADCARLEELNATSLELLATVKAKAAYSLSKLDQMRADLPTLPAPGSEARPATVAEEKPAERRPPAAKTPEAKAPEARSEPKAAEKKAPAAKPVAEPPVWSTQTKSEPPTLAPSPAGPPPAFLPPEEDGYTIEEIKAASMGLFGKLSANMASVIEHVFANSGRPRAYVIGEEGGGAFIAGVRYGSGTLYLREGGTQRIFWHGPSIGTDVGGDGSKTLFLIYKLRSTEQLYSNFTGIQGSAYFVGGVGATLTTNGEVIMAPIRSGIGLRLGANVGYIRFTPKATWNPF